MLGILRIPIRNIGIHAVSYVRFCGRGAGVVLAPIGHLGPAKTLHYSSAPARTFALPQAETPAAGVIERGLNR